MRLLLLIVLILGTGQQISAQETTPSQAKLGLDVLQETQRPIAHLQPHNDFFRFSYINTVQPPETLIRLGMSLRQIEDRVVCEHLPFDNSTGMVVASLLANHPAHKAGINVNDIVTKVGDKPVLTVDDFVQAYESVEIEDVAIEYIHAGSVRRTSINKVEAAESGKRFRIGVHTNELPEALAKHFDLSVGAGLYVTMVVEDSPAKKAGIKAGDILLVANKQELKSSSILAEAVQATRGKTPIEVEFLRKGLRSFSEILPKEDTDSSLGNASTVDSVDFFQFQQSASDPVTRIWTTQSKPIQIEQLAESVEQLRKEIAKLREELGK